jgi:hypothetical protein
VRLVITELHLAEVFRRSPTINSVVAGFEEDEFGIRYVTGDVIHESFRIEGEDSATPVGSSGGVGPLEEDVFESVHRGGTPSAMR